MRQTGPLIALLVAMVAVPVLAQPNEWPKTVYACHLSGNLDPFGGMITFNTVFHADGRIESERIEYYSGEILMGGVPPGQSVPPDTIVGPKPAGSRGTITIQWAGTGTSGDEAGPINWTSGVLGVRTHSGTAYEWRKDERWTVSMVLRDRDKEVYVVPRGTDLYLVPRSNMRLQDEPAPPGTYGFRSPIAMLLAWGSDRERLTVFMTRIKPRKYQRNSFPNSPLGEMRIIAEFELYPASLAALAQAVRQRHEGWRAEIGDFTKTCVKSEVDDPATEIVVT